jgi:hydroxypyruvate isomerase
MDRRTFSKSLAGMAAGTLAACRSDAEVQSPAGKPSYDISVMLWTVYRDLPFEQRLEKVAEAGYRNVELVGEYRNWTATQFDSAISKQNELGINFDITAGLKHGVGNPADREGLLSDVRNELPIMEDLN